MPFPFLLPSTSPLAFAGHLRSNSHPSLPFRTAVARNALSLTLQAHNRLSSSQQSSHLGTVLSALQSYVPLLLTLAKCLSPSPVVAGEEVDVVLVKEIQPKWRPTLSQTNIVERKVRKSELQGLDSEILFTLWTLGAVNCLQARVLLRTLYGFTSSDRASSLDQRTASISSAMKSLLNAVSIYGYAAELASESTRQSIPIDITESTLSALSCSALSEATLLAVLKDDPYFHIALALKNNDNTDWMIGAPKIPKIRAHLLARICIAAAEHATRAHASAQAIAPEGREAVRKSLNDDFRKYLKNQGRVARAKACRFLAIDSDADGETGKAIGWLKAGLRELGYNSLDPAMIGERGKSKGVTNRLKMDWKQRREDKRLEKDIEWGADAGRLEETRVIEMLLQKWEKMNNTVNTQAVPPEQQLLSMLPSGRDCHTVQPWSVPLLDSDALASMRGPPGVEETHLAEVNNGQDSDDEETGITSKVPSEAGSQYF